MSGSADDGIEYQDVRTDRWSVSGRSYWPDDFDSAICKDVFRDFHSLYVSECDFECSSCLYWISVYRNKIHRLLMPDDFAFGYSDRLDSWIFHHIRYVVDQYFWRNY